MSPADLCFTPATELVALIRARKLSPVELTRAVLNTSFNLHGEPLVCSAEDAVDTFERSGLPHLALGHWLISKK